MTQTVMDTVMSTRVSMVSAGLHVEHFSSTSHLQKSDVVDVKQDVNEESRQDWFCRAMQQLLKLQICGEADLFLTAKRDTATFEWSRVATNGGYEWWRRWILKRALTWKSLWCLGCVVSAQRSLVCLFDSRLPENPHKYSTGLAGGGARDRGLSAVFWGSTRNS